MHKARTATASLEGIAAVIAIPADHGPQRLPTFPSLERTSVLSFKNTLTTSVAGASSSYAMLCRDPGMPLWLTSTPFGTGNIAMGMLVNGPTGGFTTPTTLMELACPRIENVFLSPATPDGSIVPIIRYAGERYMYTPRFNAPYIPQFSVEFSVSAALGAGAKIYVDIESVSSGLNVDAFTITQSSPNVTWNGAGATNNAYNVPLDKLPWAGGEFPVAMRVTSIRIQATANVTINSIVYGLNFSSASSSTPLSNVGGASPVSVLWPAVGPPDVSVASAPWKGVRCTAAAALFSNVTAVLNKEGTVNAARIATELHNPFAVDKYLTSIASVHPRDRYYAALENGLYTFTLPDAGSEIFRDVLDKGDDTPAVANYKIPAPYLFDLEAMAYANIIVFTDIDASSTTTLAVQLDRHIEFRNTSTLFPVGFSRHTLEQYHASQMALAQLGTFFENPVHWSAIATLVRKAVATVAPIVAPYAKEAVKALGAKAVGWAANKFGMRQAGFAKPKPPPNPPAPKPKKKPLARRAGRRRGRA